MQLNWNKLHLDQIFLVHSGDFHATKELEPGSIPLVSCGETNNGVIGYFDIPEQFQYHNMLTCAYNGQPLTTKFHHYPFGAKDDVAVLKPKTEMQITTLYFIAAIINSMRWRYSYGRKCFRAKMKALEILVPTIEIKGDFLIDEVSIAQFYPLNETVETITQKASQTLLKV